MPAPGYPGLDVSFQNRGCNTLTGDLWSRLPNLKQVELRLTGFAASFEQHCEGITPALFGTIFFDSDPSRIPEPFSSTLASAALLLFAIVEKLSADIPMLR